MQQSQLFHCGLGAIACRVLKIIYNENNNVKCPMWSVKCSSSPNLSSDVIKQRWLLYQCDIQPSPLSVYIHLLSLLLSVSGLSHLLNVFLPSMKSLSSPLSDYFCLQRKLLYYIHDTACPRVL